MMKIKILIVMVVVILFFSATLYGGPFYDPICRNDIPKVLQLIKKGANINEVNENKKYALNCINCTPIGVATFFNKKEIVKMLLKNGANPNISAMYGTPLHITALNGRIEIAEMLLKHGADINKKDETLTPPIGLAIIQGKTDMVKFLIKKGALINYKTRNDCGPLHGLLTYMNHRRFNDMVQTARILIDNGADVNMKTDQGTTMLHLLASFTFIPIKYRIRMANLLLKKMNIANSKNITFGVTPLHIAASLNDLEFVRYLVANKAKIESKDNKQYTPLHRAVESKKNEMVDLLIKNGASVNILGEKNITPLHIACHNCSKEIIEMLYKKGADIQVKNMKGETPCSLVKKRCSKEIVNLLPCGQ